MTRQRYPMRSKAILAALATTVVTLIGIAMAAGLTGVSWWPGDGDTLDIVSLHNAELVGGAAYGNGHNSRAFSIPSTDSAVKLPGKALNRYEDFTFEAWVYLDSASGTIVSGANDGEASEVALVIEEGDTLHVYVKGDSFAVVLPFDIRGSFHHIVWTHSATTGVNEVYLDSALLGAVALSTGPVTIADDGLWLGQRQTSVGVFDPSPSQVFIGRLDEVAIHDSVLEQGTVLRRFELGRRDKIDERDALRWVVMNEKVNTLETEMIANQEALQGQLDTIQQMIFDSNLWDALDVEVTACASLGGGAGVGGEGSLRGKGGVDGAAAVDVYGPRAAATGKGEGEGGMKGNAEAGVGVELTACLGPKVYRASDALELRDAIVSLYDSLGLSEEQMEEAISALDNLTMAFDPNNPLEPFVEIGNALPLPGGLSSYLNDPTSILPADLASMVPQCNQDMGIFEDLKDEVCSKLPSNGPDLDTLKAAAEDFLALVNTINAIHGTVGSIHGTVGSIEGTVNDIEEVVDDICGAVDDIPDVSC